MLVPRVNKHTSISFALFEVNLKKEIAKLRELNVRSLFETEKGLTHDWGSADVQIQLSVLWGLFR